MKLKKAYFPYPTQAFDALVKFNDSLIFSVFENIAGELWVDDLKKPAISLACYKDFCFLSGKPQAVDGIKDNIFSQSDNPVLIADNSLWADYLKKYALIKKTVRYKLVAPEKFDTELLSELSEKIKACPELELKLVTSADFDSFNPEGWEHDLRGCSENSSDFMKNSLGVVIKDKNSVVCIASAYTYYSKGIEVQIETKKEYRNRGLALSASAALVLECIKRGLTPHWDAAHEQSARLALRLGFVMQGEYTAYELKKRTNEN